MHDAPVAYASNTSAATPRSASNLSAILTPSYRGLPFRFAEQSMSRFPFRSSYRRGIPRHASTGRQRPLFGRGRRRHGPSGWKTRLFIAAAVALFAVLSYYGNPGDVNQVTGNRERVAYSEEEQEIELGLQAKPQMIVQHGGPHPDQDKQRKLSTIGETLLAALDRELASQGRHNPYRDFFSFTVLRDNRVVNAFALPGGQVFVTDALLTRLTTDGMVAGVVGHEIGHVLERHGNKRIAHSRLLEGLAGAAGVAGGSQEAMQVARQLATLVQMKYGRSDELESDRWGVKLAALAGYDPRAMIGVMKVLAEAGGSGPPEFLSTHPKPANRVAYIQDVIAEAFPDGIPAGLRP